MDAPVAVGNGAPELCTGICLTALRGVDKLIIRYALDKIQRYMAVELRFAETRVFAYLQGPDTALNNIAIRGVFD